MQKIDFLLDQLDANALDNLPAVRAQIVDLIFRHLEPRRATLDDWEKIHFANAIGSLGLNINSPRQPGNSWLRLCLSDLENALTPIAERKPRYIAWSPDAQDITSEQLLAALDFIARKI